MNQIIYFIFSIFIVILGIYIVSDLYHTHTLEMERYEIENVISKFRIHLDNYCHDPFSSSKFSIDYPGKFKIYYEDNTICAVNENEEIFCEKLFCNVDTKTLFNYSSYPATYLCEINKTTVINIECH